MDPLTMRWEMMQTPRQGLLEKLVLLAGFLIISPFSATAACAYVQPSEGTAVSKVYAYVIRVYCNASFEDT